MVRYLYIDDEDSTINYLVEGLNQSGQVDVQIFNLSTYKSQEDIHSQLVKEQYDGVILDYRLNGGGPNSLDCNSNVIAQFIRDLAENKNRAECPIIMCSTKSNLDDFDIHVYTARDLYDYKFEKNFNISYNDIAKHLSILASEYQRLADKSIDIYHILGRKEDNPIDEHFMESIQMYKGSAHQLVDFILHQMFPYSGPLVSRSVLLARLGLTSVSKYADNVLSMFESAKYTGSFCAWGEYYWMDTINQVFNSYAKGKTLSTLSAKERVAILGKILRLQLEPASPEQNCENDYFWYCCEKTNIPLDPNDAYILKEGKTLFPWQELRYVSFSAISEGVVQEEDLLPDELLRFMRKVEFLKTKRN